MRHCWWISAHCCLHFSVDTLQFRVTGNCCTLQLAVYYQACINRGEACLTQIAFAAVGLLLPDGFSSSSFSLLQASWFLVSKPKCMILCWHLSSLNWKFWIECHVQVVLSFHPFSLCTCSSRCRFSSSRSCNIIRLGTWKAPCWSFSMMRYHAWNWGIWRKFTPVIAHFFLMELHMHRDWQKRFLLFSRERLDFWHSCAHCSHECIFLKMAQH